MDRKQRYRERHKKLGLCVNCSREAEPGKTRCAVCNKKHNSYRKNKSSGTQEVHQEFAGNDLVLTTDSTRIRSPEEALAKAQVDTNKWEVVRQTVSTKEMKNHTRFNITVYLKPRVPDPMETVIRGLIKRVPAWVPPELEPSAPEDTDFAMEMALYDAHFGKLAWGKETEQGSYDMEIAAHTFITAARKNLDFCSPWNISKIFFPFGQDYLHIENYQGTTPLGKHMLDVDTRLPKILLTAIEAMFDVVKLCRDVAPVEILWVPGNHDMHSSFYLSEIIKQRFREDDRVIVDNTPPWRKARLWGNLLVGFTHDANIRQTNVVNMLPQFFPELWGQSKYREWHTGHKHTKKEWKYMPTTSAGGTVIRQIPTLSPIDAWHYQEGFVDAIPAGESFIWSKHNGVIAHFTAYCGSHTKGAVV